MNATESQHAGIAGFLLNHNLIDETVLNQYIEKSQKIKSSLLDLLIQENEIDALQFTNLAASEFQLPILDLQSFDVGMIPMGYATEKLMSQHEAFPLYKRGDTLYIATSNPLCTKVLQDFRFNTGCHTEAVLVAHTTLKQYIEKLLQSQTANVLNDFSESDLNVLEINSSDDAHDDSDKNPRDDAPVVKFINKIILDAFNKGASDIHFEPYEKKYRVRFRLDGVLQVVAEPPNHLASQLTSRLKIMSHLDIAERRVPQDGRFKMKLSNQHAIDFRVSTCPTLFGEKVVLRILDPTSASMGIDHLGYEPNQKEAFMNALSASQGMILVTGPTGSGKTVSLYTGLNILNTPEKNISTAEDPVEINLAGINQVNINNKAGLNFSSALKSFLRQDPDIIMVGEIRDYETAEIAIKAAQTGHLVLSTLHTNSAPETLSRLMNMGIESYNLASSVLLIIAQRLARKLCSECKKPIHYPETSLKKLGFQDKDIAKNLTLYKAKGCKKCNQGYKGRVGIYEVMTISSEMQKLIMKGGSAIDIAEQSYKEGIHNLRQSGLEKVLQGVTTLEEINRITHK